MGDSNCEGGESVERRELPPSVVATVLSQWKDCDSLFDHALFFFHHIFTIIFSFLGIVNVALTTVSMIEDDDVPCKA